MEIPVAHKKESRNFKYNKIEKNSTQIYFPLQIFLFFSKKKDGNKLSIVKEISL